MPKWTKSGDQDHQILNQTILRLSHSLFWYYAILEYVADFMAIFHFAKLGGSGYLPGFNKNEWIPSTAASIQMTFTSNNWGTMSGFEVLVGCPVQYELGK